jgi:hypothetical protein
VGSSYFDSFLADPNSAVWSDLFLFQLATVKDVAAVAVDNAQAELDAANSWLETVNSLIP